MRGRQVLASVSASICITYRRSAIAGFIQREHPNRSGGGLMEMCCMASFVWRRCPDCRKQLKCWWDEKKNGFVVPRHDYTYPPTLHQAHPLQEHCLGEGKVLREKGDRISAMAVN
jgi:hypothetical protein